MSRLTRLRSASARSGATLAVVAAAVAGCNTDDIVSVTDPTLLQPEAVGSQAATPALVQGALRQFVGGYSGFGDDAFLTSSATISDEYYWGDTFTTRIAADSRALQPTVLGNISDPAYSRLQQARINARRAFAQVALYSTSATAAADSATRSTMRTVEGYSFVTLSEGWCGNVPFSVFPDTGTVDPSRITYRPGIGTTAMNDSAAVKFQEALALNPNNNLAKVGLGRTLLNNGRYADAAAAVASVPNTFVYRLEHSANTGSQNNPVASLLQNGRYGVSNLEGGTNAAGTAALSPGNASSPATAPSAEGLAFRGAQDPRIPWELTTFKTAGACFTTSSAFRCFLNDNYVDFNADVPLASGVEARLIEAEALLQAGLQSGDYTAMITKLNALRGAAGTPLITALYPNQKQVFQTAGVTKTLDPLAAVTTAAAARTTLFTERAFWLYNTGHRQGDLRRLVRNYGLTTTQVFPSGPYFRGGSYGNDVAYPVPFTEQDNNREFVVAGCSTTTA